MPNVCVLLPDLETFSKFKIVPCFKFFKVLKDYDFSSYRMVQSVEDMGVTRGIGLR